MRDIDALRDGTAVRVRERLPGITPSHMCSRCPTFFRARDRFYLTARHETTLHGIAVWPRGQARIRIEAADDGLLFVFDDRLWALVPDGDVPRLLGDFWRPGSHDMISWSRRRGFSIRLEPAKNGRANVRVDPPGPHFVLLVAKTWAQEGRLRSAWETVDRLQEIGAEPVVFGPSEVMS